ncbi:beta-ketoacyl-ACP synthase III [Anaerolineales bacterium]
MSTSKQIPTSFEPIYAHIVGWGMAVPESIMTNDDLSSFVETNHEWILSRTGIRERRIANETESTTQLAYQAAKKALEVADILPIDIDMIIVATSTPENIFPSTASIVQDWLGASRAGAFDLSAACSGFVYALDMATQSVRSGARKNVLVIGAETMSRVLDWSDRSTCILFGDGAGAVILQASTKEGGILASELRSDGSGCDVLTIPTIGSRDSHHETINTHLQMNRMYMVGGDVFKFATRVVSQSIEHVVTKAGLTLSDIDLIVPHQANIRILQSASKKLGIPIEQFVCNLDRYGNTSAASIPIALCEAVEQGRIKENHHLVFIGFGGGLTWASMIVKWGIPKPQERQPRVINKRRRQLSYWLARWRSRIARWRRSSGASLERFRPEGGKYARLKHRVDNQDM